MNNSLLDLSKITEIDIDYSHYYKNETGLGRHRHDTEQAQFKIYVRYRKTSDTSGIYVLILLQVTAKAHALEWLDNIYQLDTTMLELKLPFHILVEEGRSMQAVPI